MCIRDRYNRIAEAIQSLNILPERCALVESEPERTQGLRQMLVDNYSVFYIVSEDAVLSLIHISTMRLILDMVQRDGGTVTILGRDNRTVSVRTKEEISVVLGLLSLIHIYASAPAYSVRCPGVHGNARSKQKKPPVGGRGE